MTIQMTDKMPAIGKDLKVHANGIDISYDDYGNGDIPILFIHGFPFNKSMWEPQMEHLRKSNRVIAYDIRGYGKSTSDERDHEIELYADDLIAFMNALSVKKAFVCGLSMGGYILLNALDRYPDRFKAVILADTQCISDLPEVKEKRMKSIQQITGSGLTDFAAGFVKNVFCKATHDNNPEPVKMIADMILNTSPDTVKGTLGALARRSETCSKLHGITIPVMILCGKEDIVTPVSQSEFMNRVIKGSLLHIIENAGHLSNLEQPAVFNSYVEGFVGGS